MIWNDERLIKACLEENLVPAANDYSKTGRYQHQVGATPAREAR